MKLTTNIIATIMANEGYGVSYEPIIEIKTMKIIAYEALSRFSHQGEIIPPSIFFKHLHEDLELFFYVESIIKNFQIVNRPLNKELFLNIDPDVAIDPNHVVHWVTLFSKNKNIVAEIIENSDDENTENVNYFIDWMDEYNIPFAYDDFGKPNSIFFDSLLHRANNIKLDINFIRTIRDNNAFIEMAKGLTAYAKRTNKRTIMEGIENEKDLEIAKEVGVDCVQGFLFKDKFIDKYKKEKNIIQTERITTSHTLEVLKKLPLVISAHKYFKDMDMDYELIAEFNELEEDVLSSIHKEAILTHIALHDSATLFNNYAKILATLFEFKQLSDTLRKLSLLLFDTDINELTDETKTYLYLYLEAIIIDLQNWRISIFIEQVADDIHYLDKTLLSSILQLEITLTDECLEETQEIEFF